MEGATMTTLSFRNTCILSGLIALSALSGCDRRGGKVDIASIQDTTLITPETTIVLPISSRQEVKLYDHWYDIYSDANQIEEYLSRQAARYQAMYEEYGVPVAKRLVRQQPVSILPTQVVIEPEAGAKMGSISRLTRVCREHGFYNVTVRRAGDANPS
jgi:hypothetical protein